MTSSIRRPATTADSAYEQLRSLIHRGELQPNERLVEADLAERLQVSRAVVRTALVRLGQDGVVVLTPHRGARVRMVTESEAVEIVQARAVLEALTARQAAVHATAREIAGLRRTLARMRRKLDENDLLGYSEGNAALHAGIIAASRHETAARLIAGLRGQMVRFQFRTILVPGRPPESLAEHTAIVEAIGARDADAAESTMRHHLRGVEHTLSRTTGAAARRRSRENQDQDQAEHQAETA
ncbi:GntR family transcriptional regulator [Actinoplanes sp. NBRC 14428]|uniref:GntR family transcriptional regulator n=1 Tax=Pseudosporangium ferrugineum TaxID=439699 RepID=A0A2T0RLN6_9ACTN|nr:GntR family transcriptional regulator [Pseudosporangium ferrugineum]PRY22047.1 GntR family transcriptional regulator [Pseudosporangium ferrugineum]BCJ50676.1 GntR family transcriptional regulator [Actinoplanes sp. NBRC 14428]